MKIAELVNNPEAVREIAEQIFVAMNTPSAPYFNLFFGCKEVMEELADQIAYSIDPTPRVWVDDTRYFWAKDGICVSYYDREGDNMSNIEIPAHVLEAEDYLITDYIECEIYWRRENARVKADREAQEGQARRRALWLQLQQEFEGESHVHTA
jgi:hypothetical protein